MLLPNFIQLNLNPPNPIKIIPKHTGKEEMKNIQFALKGTINHNKTNIRQENETPDESETIFLHVTKCTVPSRKIKKHQYVISKTKLKYKKENDQKQQQNNQRANKVQVAKYKYLKRKQNVRGEQQKKLTHANSQTVQPSNYKGQTDRERKEIRRTKHNSTQMSIKQKKKQSVKELGKDEVVMKLNLGIKKSKDKGKMREYFQSVLARTKIDDIIPIKRSPYQPSPPAYHQVSSVSRQKKEVIANDQQNQIIKTQKRLLANKKLNIQRSNINKKSQIRLPSLNQYRNIVEIVKKDEKERRKRLFLDDSEENNLPFILLPKSALNSKENNQKQKNKTQNPIIIEQEIQYCSIGRQKQEKQTQIIRQSIHIQKN